MDAEVSYIVAKLLLLPHTESGSRKWLRGWGNFRLFGTIHALQRPRIPPPLPDSREPFLLDYVLAAP